MRSRLLFLILGVSISLARAAVQRALLVGIDQYAEPTKRAGYEPSERTRSRLKAIDGRPSRTSLDRLDGAFNDAQAMKEILVGKFGFEERNVIVLPDAARPATADNILGLLESFLIDGAKPGDASLFYFAGHGSRIRNTATGNRNSGGFDSTIIPADALLGVPDIRSKELARIYALAPQKGVTLTVIQDSCFSGGASRGAMSLRKFRSQPPNLGISVHETLAGPLLEDAGVLIMYASQDYEPAAELSSTDLGGPHGAFTWALLHVLGASPANESVDRIFERVRALMQSRAPGQEPVLLTKQGRNQRGLFGQPAPPGQTATVAAGKVVRSIVKLNGGLAMSLHEGCELRRVAPASPAVEIRVSKVNGMSSSDAVVTAGGDAPVRPGDLFELDKWVVPDRELMRVFVGPAVQPGELRRAAKTAAELRARAPAMWIEDPTARTPTHLVSWDAAKSQWSLRENVTGAKPVWINALSADRVLDLAPPDARIFVLIPPSPELAKAIELGASVSLASAPDRADYVLLGRACPGSEEGCIEYAWALPDVTGEDLGQKHAAIPLRSDWFAGDASALINSALKLARVAGWLDLSPPESSSRWPYHLALQNTETKRVLDSSEVRDGEQYKLILRAAPGAIRAGVPTRRVYVFVLDSFGKATLVFPHGNLDNEFPSPDAAGTPPETIMLTNADQDLTIAEPYGVDHYFLLSSANPIDNPQAVLNFEGARTRGGDPQGSDPLARLLHNTATGTRGEVARIPVNWSIERLSLVSLPLSK
jgi:hypothetical protein